MRYNILNGKGMLSASLAFLALALCRPLAAVEATALTEKGAVVLKLNFETAAEREKWSSAPGTQWVQEVPGGNWCMAVEVAGKNPGGKMVSLLINLAPWRGMVLHFQCQAKAEGVAKPAQPYNGIKFMLHFKAPSGERWTNQNNLFGTFDWKPVGFSFAIPEDADAGEL
jgi:hypothetical protein